MIGQFKWFEYHCYEGEDSSDAPAWHHTHQNALVVRELGSDEVDIQEVGRMYEVVFEDGLRWSVFEDELLTGPEENERPDYDDGSQND